MTTALTADAGQRRPYRVLSLDGGGMRGIYTAAFLERLVDHFARSRGAESLDLGKGFDLITGTSTGAIVDHRQTRLLPVQKDLQSTDHRQMTRMALNSMREQECGPLAMWS